MGGLEILALISLSTLFLANDVRGRPNFLIFMADDLGYGDLGFTGNTDVETPNIDKLGRESVFLPNFYVSPVCTPTRASLLTGRYFLRTGVWGVHGGRDFLNMDESTFGDVLSDAGYATALFGKWHNGKTDGYFPWDRGFHEACMIDLYHYFDNKATCNGQRVYTQGWVQDTIAYWSKDFLTRKNNEGMNFMLYVPFMTPHLGSFGGEGEEYWHAKDFLVEKYKEKGLSDGLSRLYGMVEMMDDTVGSILDHLDNLGIGDNTVVMFLSDNGATGKERIDDWWRRNHMGLNGEKGEVGENGIRSPLFVRWRGHFPGGETAHSQLGSVEDIFPTLSELAETGHGNKPVDGVSLIPVLYSPQEDQGFSERTIYSTIMAPEWTRPGGRYQPLPDLGNDKSGLVFGRAGRWAVREGRWKYINVNGGDFLYDMMEDPLEKTTIKDHSTIKRLKGKLSDWWHNMVSDSGSFTTPSFLIGYPGSKSGLIIPSAVAEASGSWTIRTHDIHGDVGPGQYVKYKVTVSKPSGYHIKVDESGDYAGFFNFEFQCGDSYSYVNGAADGNGYVGHIFLPRPGQDCILTVSVVAGWGNVQLSSIRLEPSGHYSSASAFYARLRRAIQTG